MNGSVIILQFLISRAAPSVFFFPFPHNPPFQILAKTGQLFSLDMYLLTMCHSRHRRPTGSAYRCHSRHRPRAHPSRVLRERCGRTRDTIPVRCVHRPRAQRSIAERESAAVRVRGTFYRRPLHRPQGQVSNLRVDLGIGLQQQPPISGKIGSVSKSILIRNLPKIFVSKCSVAMIETVGYKNGHETERKSLFESSPIGSGSVLPRYGRMAAVGR
jgi:hypothetical protein